MKNSIAAFLAIVALSFAAQAEFYWLAVGIKANAGYNTDGGWGNYLILTNDDPSVSYKPVKLYDVRRTVAGGTTLKKFNGCNTGSPYEGCAYGEAEYDLTLPIYEGETECTLVGIGSEAFRGNSYLGSIKLPNSLQSIETRAFWQCYYLTDFEWPADMTNLTIAERLFDTCTRLSGPMEWPSKFTSVGSLSFTSCNALTGFGGLSVTNVGDYAFQNCDALKTLEFGDGDSLTFGYRVFQSSTHIKTVIFHSATPVLNGNFTGIDSNNTVMDFWGKVPATVYVPFNAAKDGPLDSWETFKTNYEAVYDGNSITWPTKNEDGTWADGSFYNAKVEKTLVLRFWDPNDTSSTALLAH